VQRIRELDEFERLEQIRDRSQEVGLVLGGLVDAGADDREARVVVPQPQGGLERRWVGRLDEDAVRLGNEAAVQEHGVVTQPSQDRRIQLPDVHVGFDDQETSHEHVVAGRRMFSRAGYV
jgi:hypothetical protein